MNITKVELWLKECYGCRASKYIPLHDWFLSLEMPLNKFEAIRVPLKKEWQNFAKKMAEVGIDLPFVVIRTDSDDTQAIIYRYDMFIKEIERSKRMNITKEEQQEIMRRLLKKQKADAVETIQLNKKPQPKKQSVVKKNKTKTTEVK